MIPVASRPLTQQGMTGLQTAQGSSAGTNRQIRDKRYYMSSIRGRMNHISEEVNKLIQKLSEFKLEAANHDHCKKQYDSLIEDLKTYQDTLTVYNMAIETSMMKGTESDIDAETERLRSQNQTKEEQLEGLYSETVAKKDELKKLEDDIQEETSQYNEIIHTLPDEMQTEYYKLNEVNKQLEEEEGNIKEEMANLHEKMKRTEPLIFESDMKRRRYDLVLQLMELKTKIDKIKDEEKLMENPEEERIYLLDQVKKNRDDIESFKYQESDLKNDLNTAKDRLSELDDELSESNSARLNKYRELLKRQETMDTFLSTYDATHNSLIKKIRDYKNNIDFSLEYISENSALLGSENSQKNLDTNAINMSSVADMMREIKKSQSCMNMLHAVKERLKKDLETTITEEQELKMDLEKLKDIETSRNNLLENINSQENQKESLKNLLRTTKMAVNEAKIQKRNIERELQGNQMYEEINSMEKTLEELIEENNQLASSSAGNGDTGDADHFKRECMDYVYRINNLLKQL